MHETGVEAWFHPESGRRVEQLPPLLGNGGNAMLDPINLPPAPEVLVVRCDHCLQAPAVLACGECQEYYCGMCFKKRHRKRRAGAAGAADRVSHSTVVFPLCQRCGYMAGVRSCNGCEEPFYCETCFSDSHAYGLRVHHTAAWTINDLCGQCHAHPALFHCEDCDMQRCGRCHHDTHVLDEAARDSHTRITRVRLSTHEIDTLFDEVRARPRGCDSVQLPHTSTWLVARHRPSRRASCAASSSTCSSAAPRASRTSC